MIAVLVILACVSAFVLFYASLWDWDDDAVLLGNPRVRYLVIAGSYSEAAAEASVPRDQWRYVSSTSDLLGYRAGDVEFRLVGTWARNPIFNDPWAYQRLRSLGLHAFPERSNEL